MSEKAFKGIILWGVGGLYGVRPYPEIPEPAKDGAGNATVYVCRARGAFRHEGITPLPGDSVEVYAEGENADKSPAGVIESIDARRNSLVRPALANLTHIFAVIPAAQPAPVLSGADKLICAAESRGIEPVIAVTKAELSPESAEEILKIYRGAGFAAFGLRGDGSTDEGLCDYLARESAQRGVCAAFAGVSGAGKSTLMTRLFPDLRLATGELSRKIQRGRHTTRRAELYPVKVGGELCFIADTPGFSVMDFSRCDYADASELPYLFREFAPLMGKCRYTKCTHTLEEGCAVLEKTASGEISQSRHKSYCEMLEDIRRNPPWKKNSRNK